MELSCEIGYQIEELRNDISCGESNSTKYLEDSTEKGITDDSWTLQQNTTDDDDTYYDKNNGDSKELVKEICTILQNTNEEKISIPSNISCISHNNMKDKENSCSAMEELSFQQLNNLIDIENPKKHKKE